MEKYRHLIVRWVEVEKRGKTYRYGKCLICGKCLREEVAG